MPLISVIIPAYNSAGTIGEALKSVAAQTFADYEGIVVDDGSKDDTVRVVEKWIDGQAKSGPAWRLLRLAQNSGPAVARNRGIEIARGEWLAFLDADDAWMPWRLDKQMTFVAEHPQVTLVCGKTAGFGEFCEPLAGAAQDCEVEQFAVKNPVATSTVLVRRAAVTETGGFDPQFRGPEDYDLWMRIAGRHAVVLMDAFLARYRYSPGSLSMDDRKFLPQVLRVLAKAFGPGGSLAGHPELRRKAEANQYWNASWMAFQRGSRGQALRHLARAVARDRHVGGSLKLPVLWRYLLGKPESGPRRNDE